MLKSISHPITHHLITQLIFMSNVSLFVGPFVNDFYMKEY